MEPGIGALEQKTGYRWVSVGTWLFAAVTGFMIIHTMGILLPAVSRDLGLSPGQQGMLMSAAFWANLTLAIPMSWWTSRYPPKVLTIVTMALSVLLLYLQAWAPAFLVLLAGRMGFGMTIIAREPARALLVQQWFAPREVVMPNSVSNAMYGLIVGGGLALTPLLLEALDNNWRMVLAIYATFLLAILVLWTVFGRERRRVATEERRSPGTPAETGLIKRALSYRDLWIAGFGFMGATLAMSAFVSFFPTMMLETYETSLAWSGRVLASSTFLGGIAGLVIGFTSMRGNPNRILQVLGLLMAGSYILLTTTASTPLLLILAVANGIAWGFWPVLYSVPYRLPEIRPREVAVAASFMMMMISAGTVVGPLVTGFLQEALGDLRVPLLIVGIGPVSITAAGTAIRVFK